MNDTPSRPRIPARLGIAAALLLLLSIVIGWGALAGRRSAPATTTATHALSGTPYPLPAALAGRHIVVTDLESGDIGVLGATTLLTGGGPHGLGLQPGGRFLWVSNVDSDQVWIVDLQGAGQPKIVGTVTVGLSPVHVAFSPDGTRAYVTNFGGTTISVVDVARRVTIAAITTPLGPHGIVISPDGSWLYVACPRGGAFVVVDTAQDQVVTTVPLRPGATPFGVALSPDGTIVYASDAAFNQLIAIDTTTRVEVGVAPVGTRPALVAWIPTTHAVAVANNGSSTVTIVDTSTMRVVATVPTGTAPHGVAASPDGQIIVTANTGSHTLTAIDVGHAAPIAQIPVGRFPNDVIILP